MTYSKWRFWLAIVWEVPHQLIYEAYIMFYWTEGEPLNYELGSLVFRAVSSLLWFPSYPSILLVLVVVVSCSFLVIRRQSFHDKLTQISSRALTPRGRLDRCIQAPPAVRVYSQVTDSLHLSRRWTPCNVLPVLFWMLCTRDVMSVTWRHG
jgi:hypothetical protein